MRQHKKIFENFDIEYIGLTENCEKIEKLFQKQLINCNLRRSIMFMVVIKLNYLQLIINIIAIIGLIT
ncbi:MAG: hypothetical protein EOP34_07120 [Rickettsiales bacterium]|nr:MAG: hypothetical protein EOP34_07120 [Rickettsiales bacterium]